MNKAFLYGLLALVLLAAGMVGFYHFRHRFEKADYEYAENTDTPREEKSEFVGIYSPADGPLEAAGKRIAYFQVNRREDGGYLASAKMDSIGSNEAEFLPCNDVRIEEEEFFLQCQHGTLGSLSLNGRWYNANGIVVDGKVLWTQNGTLHLEVQRKLQHISSH